MALRSACSALPGWISYAMPALLVARQQLMHGYCSFYANSSSFSSSCFQQQPSSSPLSLRKLHVVTQIEQQQGHYFISKLISYQSLSRSYCKWATPSTPAAAAAQPAIAALQQQQSAEEAASSFINTDAATAAATAAASGAATGGAAAAAAASAGGVLAGVTAAPGAEYTMRQVAKHSTDETCWIVVNGKVYDVTSYIDDHPGGAESILLNAGVDCTEEFMGVHTQEAKDLLQKFVIGRVKPGTKKPKDAATAVAQPAAVAATKPLPRGPLVTLQDPRERYALPLAEKRQLNHDTFFMRFELPSPKHQLGLPCGKHVFLCADINGEAIVRAYTPISGDRDLGVLDLLIKVYWAGAHPKFPQGGKMSQYLAALKEGDKLDVKGPYGKFTYEGLGQYNLNRAAGNSRYMSMVAGGSGVTPCYSVLKEVLRNDNDHTRCALIYANKHEEDIWLRQELDTMARNNPDRFHLWYVLEEPGTAPTPVTRTAETAAANLLAAANPHHHHHQQQQQQQDSIKSDTGSVLNLQQLVNPMRPITWTFSRGYITHDMMAQHLLPPQPVQVVTNLNVTSPSPGQQAAGGSLALMCGPPGMLEGVVVPGLAAMGYGAGQMVLF